MPRRKERKPEVEKDIAVVARICISDVERIVQVLAEGKTDIRIERIMLEAATTKAASAFQLLMRAYDHIGRADLRRDLISRHKKNESVSAVSRISGFRDKNFHHGEPLLHRETIYPFCAIKGHGFVGLWIEPRALFA